MSLTTYAAKPGYHKGGKGHFTRLASPCEFEFAEQLPPMLHIHHCPPSNIWLALLATIITTFVVKATGFMIGPGMIIWYLIINAVRRNKVDIDLSQVQKVVADAKKKEVSVFGTIVGKQTWVGLKCSQHFTSIVDRLKQSGQVSVVDGKMQTSQLGMVIVIVFVLWALIALIIVGFIISVEQ